MLSTPREIPQLKLLSFGHLETTLYLTTGLHNISARRYDMPLIDPVELQEKLFDSPRWNFEHQSDDKIYQHSVVITDAGLRELLFSARDFDGAIWVTEGVLPSSEYALMLRVLSCCGVSLIIFLVRPAKISEDELDMRELELREHCSLAGFSGDEIKIVRGVSSEDSVQALYEACDQVFFPKPKDDDNFLMPVEDVFSIQHKGTIVTGRVGRGKVKIGDEVELLGIRPTKKTTVVGVEAFRRVKDFAVAGDNIGILLRGLKKNEIDRGQVLAKPGSIVVGNLFEAVVYFYPPEHGPKYPPLVGQNFRMIVSGAWSGQATLSRGEFVSGGYSMVTIRTKELIALEALVSFAVIAEGRSAGQGIVTKLLENSL
jgi:elongation factor Tu